MKRVALGFLALSAVVTMPVSHADAAEPVETAISDWVASIEASTDWIAQFESLAYDDATDTAVLTGLRIGHPAAGVIVTFEPISITGYDEEDDGTFGAQAISGAGASVVGEGLSAKLEGIEIKGLGNVPMQFGGEAGWDDERPFTSIVRAYSQFVDVELEHGRIASIEMDLLAEGEDLQITYDNLTIDGWADGKVASTTTGLVKFTATTPQGPFTMSIAEAEAREMDYAAVMRVYDPDQYVGGVGDQIWRPAMAFFEYRDLVFESQDGKFSIDAVTAENIQVRQPERSFAEFFDKAMLNPNANTEPTPEEMRVLIDYFSAFSLGSMSMSDFNLDAKDGTQGRTGKVQFEDFSAAGLGEFSVDDFRISPEGAGIAAIDRIAIGGLVFPSLEALVEAAEAEAKGTPFDYSKLTVQMAFFEALGLDFDVPDSPRFRLDKGRLDLGNYVGPVPTLVALEIAGIDLPASAIDDPAIRAAWQAAGYDRLQGDLLLRLAWNEDDSSVVIDDFSIALADVGALSLDASLSGLDRESLMNIEQIPDKLAELSFVEGSLTIEDYTALDRWIDLQAAVTGAQPDDLRTKVASTLPALVAGIGDDSFEQTLLRVLEASVMAPGIVKATAAPPAPVPMAVLIVLAQTAPKNLPGLLGLTIERIEEGAPAPQ